MKKKSKYGKEQEGYALHKIEKQVIVTDNWYPCYEGNKINVSMHVTNLKDSHFVKITASGADDFAVELIYRGTNYDDLMYHYNFWKEYIFDKVVDGINVKWFYERGFFNA